MVPLYVCATVISAFLVFFIQPVIAKMALPVLGGTPAVWSGCMLFFQAALLMGYLYAHVLGIQRSRMVQFGIHAGLLLVVVCLFPLHVELQQSGVDTAANPVLSLILALVYSIGLPFFAISASSPLLQKWFAQTRHPNAHNPYFLYAAGNAGSLAALLTYPIIIEPFFPLAGQFLSWQYGIGVLALFFAGVIWVTRHRLAPVSDTMQTAEAHHIDHSDVTAGRRIMWVLMAFVPSSLLYAVTSYITTDLFSAPMLWLLPLTLYLLTFIFAFETRLIGYKLADRYHQLLVFFAVFLLMMTELQQPIYIVVHILAFFCVAMYMHGRLSLSKPRTEHLTEFFLFLSFGGVLGGIFNTFITPVLFNSILEYPLILLLSVFLRIPVQEGLREIRHHLKALVFAIVLIGIGTYSLWLFKDVVDRNGLPVLAVMLGALVLAVRYRSHPAVWALGLGILAAMGSVLISSLTYGLPVYVERNIFGVYRIYNKKEAHTLVHGTTLHGIQLKDPDLSKIPVSYYYGLKGAFRSVEPQGAPVAVLGLGTGSVACHGLSGQEIDFFEIDPLVVDIAGDDRYFSYLSQCPAKSAIILGDARLRLGQQPDGKYGLIIADTFSSDSIPVHMMTKEAIAEYMDKLAPHGLLAFHISNRSIDLRPVVSAIADTLGLHAAIRHIRGEETEFEAVERWTFPSIWVVLAKNEADIQRLYANDATWKPLPKAVNEQVWTDDFSNVFLSLRPIRAWRGTEMKID